MTDFSSMIPKAKHTTNPRKMLSTSLFDNSTTIAMIIKVGLDQTLKTKTRACFPTVGEI